MDRTRGNLVSLDPYLLEPGDALDVENRRQELDSLFVAFLRQKLQLAARQLGLAVIVEPLVFLFWRKESSRIVDLELRHVGAAFFRHVNQLHSLPYVSVM